MQLVGNRIKKKKKKGIIIECKWERKMFNSIHQNASIGVKRERNIKLTNNKIELSL